MRYYYLDTNIYIYTLDNQSIIDTVTDLKSKGIGVLYSPAHIEEIYRAQADNTELLMDRISTITDDMECLPGENGVVVRKEKLKNCYYKVARYDTRQLIQSRGEEKNYINKEFRLLLNTFDKKMRFLSNLDCIEIWNYSYIQDSIKSFNENIKFYKEKYNNSGQKLPDNLQLKKQNYDNISQSFSALECCMEYLFGLLELFGYNADKKEKTISGIHDVTHAIYATKAEKLFTADKRFAKCCKAVYAYLGVPTEVILCDTKNISEILKNVEIDMRISNKCLL